MVSIGVDENAVYAKNMGVPEYGAPASPPWSSTVSGVLL